MFEANDLSIQVLESIVCLFYLYFAFKELRRMKNRGVRKYCTTVCCWLCGHSCLKPRLSLLTLASTVKQHSAQLERPHLRLHVDLPRPGLCTHAASRRGAGAEWHLLLVPLGCHGQGGSSVLQLLGHLLVLVSLCRRGGSRRVLSPLTPHVCVCPACQVQACGFLGVCAKVILCEPAQLCSACNKLTTSLCVCTGLP